MTGLYQWQGHLLTVNVYFFVNSELKYLQKYLVCTENLPATSHGSDLIVLLAAHCQNV